MFRFASFCVIMSSETNYTTTYESLKEEIPTETAMNMDTKSALPKVRGIEGVIKELKKDDPDCPFTVHALRKAIKNGSIPVVMSGRKIFVNMNSVYDYLRGSV